MRRGRLDRRGRHWTEHVALRCGAGCELDRAGMGAFVLEFVRSNSRIMKGVQERI